MNNEYEIISSWQASDYRENTTPFEWLYQFKDNKFKLAQLREQIKVAAGAVGVKNFVALWNAYLSTMQAQRRTSSGNVTEFDGQEMELECGEWFAGDYGISFIDRMGFETVACNHPVMPVQRLINIDTGIEKIRLAYKKGRMWRTIIADKRTLASASSIVGLADYGLAVNSENAKYLVRYLTDIEHLNYEAIPEVNSIGRLGWIDNYGFSPYDLERMIFDGEQTFKHMFEAVQSKGNYDTWLELVKGVRGNGKTARIVLAASFASVLVKPCGALPFFVHLWGGTETGKTVGLLLAASVWADPHLGKYITTFNSTAVAQELMAGFCNSLPLILDELQVQKDKRQDFDSMIYKLTEGIGRMRGQKTGGLQQTVTWSNCFLSNGEHPINNGNSGGGAVNRIIDIDCGDTKLFVDPVFVAETLKKNYGFAGRIFIEKLKEDGTIDKVVAFQRQTMQGLLANDTTEKQAQAASLILTADKFVTDWIFQDDNALTKDDIATFLSSKDDVSQNRRALDYIYGFVAINKSKFESNSFGDYSGEVWGKIENGWIYIIKTKFDRLMQDEAYNATAFLGWAKRSGILDHARDRHTKKARINKGLVWCVCIKESEQDWEDLSDDEPLPFYK